MKEKITNMKPRMLPAHPPEDYTGSVADWMIELQMRGWWDGEGWYGDVEIPESEWRDILDFCEGGRNDRDEDIATGKNPKQKK